MHKANIKMIGVVESLLHAYCVSQAHAVRVHDSPLISTETLVFTSTWSVSSYNGPEKIQHNSLCVGDIMSSTWASFANIYTAVVRTLLTFELNVTPVISSMRCNVCCYLLTYYY